MFQIVISLCFRSVIVANPLSQSLKIHSNKTGDRYKVYTLLKGEKKLEIHTNRPKQSHWHTVHISISRWHISHRNIFSNFGWLTDGVILWWHPTRRATFVLHISDLKHLCLARLNVCCSLNMFMFQYQLQCVCELSLWISSSFRLLWVAFLPFFVQTIPTQFRASTRTKRIWCIGAFVHFVHEFKKRLYHIRNASGTMRLQLNAKEETHAIERERQKKYRIEWVRLLCYDDGKTGETDNETIKMWEAKKENILTRME